MYGGELSGLFSCPHRRKDGPYQTQRPVYRQTRE
jgi:hypothetical protein